MEFLYIKVINWKISIEDGESKSLLENNLSSFVSGIMPIFWSFNLIFNFPKNIPELIFWIFFLHCMPITLKLLDKIISEQEDSSLIKGS